jgi:hypothetical protein
MTKYLANENGDWWAVGEGEGYLFLIDDTDPAIAEAMKSEDASPNDDKFERFIQRHGKVVYIDEC